MSGADTELLAAISVSSFIIEIDKLPSTSSTLTGFSGMSRNDRSVTIVHIPGIENPADKISKK